MGVVIAILIFLFCPLILIFAVASAFIQVVLQCIAVALALGAFFLLITASVEPALAKKAGTLALLAFFVMLLAPLTRAVRLMSAGYAGLGVIWTDLVNIGPLLGMVASTGALLLLFSLREMKNIGPPILFSIGLVFNAGSMFLGADFSPTYDSELILYGIIILRVLYIACLLWAYISTFKFSVWRTERVKDRRLVLAIPASLVVVAVNTILYFVMLFQNMLSVISRLLLILQIAAVIVLAWCFVAAVSGLRREKREAKRAELSPKELAEAEAADAERAKKRKKVLKIAGIAAVAVAVPVAILMAVSVVQNMRWRNEYNQEKYEAALALVESGDYDIHEAIAAFDALEGYKDSAQRAQELRDIIYPQYMECVAVFETSKESEDVAAAFETVGGIDFFDDRMPVLTAEEILDTIGGPWHAYKDYNSEENGYWGHIERNFCFYSNGRTYEMGYSEGTWRVDGSQLLLRAKNSYAEKGYIDYVYEVRQVTDGVYMLVNVTYSRPSVEYLFRQPLW